jgi:Kdo2-lipid IVA lauroyltransferase/acyltransferase
MNKALARVLIWMLGLLAKLPLRWQAAIGWGFGGLLLVFAHSRRRIAQRNLELCFPQASKAQRQLWLREHFGWLGRSLLERAYLWFAPVDEIRRHIEVVGDVGLAERSSQPTMWIVPHFVALEVAGAAAQLFQTRTVVDIYQAQSNAVFDAALKAGRLRFGRAEAYPRGASVRPVIKRIREGCPFFNMPDQDFGLRDGVFAPFFGIEAATLLAPARMAHSLGMQVQLVLASFKPGGAGYRVEWKSLPEAWPSGDAEADTRRLNEWIEAEVRAQPAQYLWVHKRFKTRPPGQASLYEGHAAR